MKKKTLFLLLITFSLTFFKNENDFSKESIISKKDYSLENEINLFIKMKPEISEKSRLFTANHEDIEEELYFDSLSMVAQLVQAEAGNQDLTGKRLVVDVVFNRVRSDEFPNTIEEVIFQSNQFSVIADGAFERAAQNVSEECYEAVKLECESQLNYDILYFGREKSKYATEHFKHQDHWFGW